MKTLCSFLGLTLLLCVGLSCAQAESPDEAFDDVNAVPTGTERLDNGAAALMVDFAKIGKMHQQAMTAMFNSIKDGAFSAVGKTKPEDLVFFLKSIRLKSERTKEGRKISGLDTQQYILDYGVQRAVGRRWYKTDDFRFHVVFSAQGTIIEVDSGSSTQ